MDTGFQLRAPWYVRERNNESLRDARSRRPSIQMYGDSTFVDSLLNDPRDSLKPTADDKWSYPVPVTPSTSAKGRARFATSTLVTTDLRKLYQPGHDRYYAVVVEVFCDTAGLPRAGSHEDLEVSFVMRRQLTSLEGDKRDVRQLARNILVEMAATQHSAVDTKDLPLDLPEVFWADAAAKQCFEEDNARLLSKVHSHTDVQAWITGGASKSWRSADGKLAEGESEESFRMWRLPPAEVDDCEAAHSRSLWFGIIPTFSPDHWVDAKGKTAPKLDDHAVYELLCNVKHKEDPAKKDCPPKIYWSEATEPFRLAAPFDPEGTKNHTTSITMPDLRRLAARAASPQGPGGVRITTPPGSALPPIAIGDLGKSGVGAVGLGGSICTFAFELFFIVAFFLFLMFLPIVIFAFQLWWMLALRFCFPPSAAFKILSDFFVAGNGLPDLALPVNKPTKDKTDELLGMPGGAAALITQPDFAAQPDMFVELVDAMNPGPIPAVPTVPPVESKPDDPLCAKV